MTHVYNGMTRYHHRNPGLVGAAFRIRDVYGEIICDGCHSHLAALNNFFAVKGAGLHAALDCAGQALSARGQLPAGRPRHRDRGGRPGPLEGHGHHRREHPAHEPGLQILVEKAMVPFDAALNSCTINPARCLGVDGRKGRIAAGCSTGDLVVLEEQLRRDSDLTAAAGPCCENGRGRREIYGWPPEYSFTSWMKYFSGLVRYSPFR